MNEKTNVQKLIEIKADLKNIIRKIDEVWIDLRIEETKTNDCPRPQAKHNVVAMHQCFGMTDAMPDDHCAKATPNMEDLS